MGTRDKISIFCDPTDASETSGMSRKNENYFEQL